MPYFGKTSSEKLSTCHYDLQLIHKEAIKQIPVDYGIHEGHRSEEKQLEYFLKGWSKIDPRTGTKGKHMYKPSLATDMHVSESHNGKNLMWDSIHLAFVAGYIIRVSQELYDAGKISHKLRWGGDWNGNGVIALDQTLIDFPHLELVKG